MPAPLTQTAAWVSWSSGVSGGTCAASIQREVVWCVKGFMSSALAEGVRRKHGRGLRVQTPYPVVRKKGGRAARRQPGGGAAESGGLTPRRSPKQAPLNEDERGAETGQGGAALR